MTTSPHETTPLLEGQNESQNEHSPQPSPKYGLWHVVAVTCSAALLFDVAGYLGVTAQTAIFEEIVCQEYHATHVLDQEGCKIEPIQTEIALLNALIDTFQTIPGILLGLPYGILADRIGYKPVMLLAILGCVLGDTWVKFVCWLYPILPLRAVWFSCLWQLLGGGPQVLTSMCFVTVANVCPATLRTRVFSQMTAALLLSELIATPAGAALMAIHPWVPFLASTGLSVSSFVFALLLFPETLGKDQTSEIDGPFLPHEGQPVALSASDRIREAIDKLRAVGQWARQNLNLMLVVLCSLFSVLAKQSLGLFIQYGSKKFHLSLAQVSYFIPLRAGVNLLVLAVLLPTVSALITSKLGLAVPMREKRLSQISVTLLLLGCIAVFIAPTPILLGLGLALFGLGSSLPVTTRTLLTCLVEPELLATAYTMIGVVTSIGMLVAGPILASTFQLGMKMGEFWIGLPFLFAAGMYTVVLIAVSAVKVPVGQ